MKSTIEYLVDLIQIDTQNYKANESQLVDYLIEFCRKHKVVYKTYYKDENRKNIIISVGKPTEKDLIVLGHTDVVTANEEDGWACPPFSGKVIDGYLYGRGAIDMKYVIASSLSIIGALKKIEHKLKRGIHFVFAADEENGSDYGMKHLMTYSEVRQLLSNKIAINEGGGFSLKYKNQLYYLYETGQKSVARIKVSVKKIANSSPYFPSLDHEGLLVEAITAIEGIDLKSSLPKTTVKLLRTLVDNTTILEKDLLGELAKHADKKTMSLLKSMSESYITATMIKGGSRNKTLSPEIKGEAIFDIRLLPNITKNEVVNKIKASVKDLGVEVEFLTYSQGFEADIDQPIVELFEKSLKGKNDNITSLLPFITPGSNDGKFLKEVKSIVFGFAPLCEEDAFIDVITGIHSVNERIRLESIDFNKEILEEVIVNYLREE